MQDIPAVRQGMASLPQLEEDEQYDQNKIQIDRYAQEREISVIESFWPCVHINNGQCISYGAYELWATLVAIA